MGQYALTSRDGQKVYDVVHPSFACNQSVELDFSGVEIYNSQFFGFAFGQLLKDIPLSQINEIKLIGISADGRGVLKCVMNLSKKYYYERQN